MSLYWEKGNVAVEIADDPLCEPFDREAHPDATVLQITCEELMDAQAFGRFARTLAAHLDGTDVPADRIDRAFASKQELTREGLFGGSAW